MLVVNGSNARNAPIVAIASPLDAKKRKKKGGRLTAANAAFLRSLGFVVPRTVSP